MTPAAQAIQQIRDHLGMMDKSERYEKWRMKKALELLAALPDALVGELEKELIDTRHHERYRTGIRRGRVIIREAFAGESSNTQTSEGGRHKAASSPPRAPACSEIPVVEEALWEKIHDTVKYSIAIFNSQPHFVVNGIMNTIRPYLRTTEPNTFEYQGFDSLSPREKAIYLKAYDRGLADGAPEPVMIPLSNIVNHLHKTTAHDFEDLKAIVKFAYDAAGVKYVD